MHRTMYGIRLSLVKLSESAMMSRDVTTWVVSYILSEIFDDFEIETHFFVDSVSENTPQSESVR